MSSWTHISADISIDGVKKEFIKKVYKLRSNISDYKYDEFVNNYKNFDYHFTERYDSKYLVKDYTKQVKKFLDETPILTGSEGPCEMVIGDYPKAREIWGDDCHWCGTRYLNTKTERLVSDMFVEEYDDKDVEDIWETSVGDKFHLFLYGSMRDRIYEESEKELIEYIKTLNKYFNLGVDKSHITLGDGTTEAEIEISWTGEGANEYNIKINRTITTWYQKRKKWKSKVTHNSQTIVIGKEQK